MAEVKITKLVKTITVVDPADGQKKIVEDDVYAYDKDVDKYLAEGYKDTSIEIANKSFTNAQKKRYIDGEDIEKTVAEVTPEQKEVQDFQNRVMSSTVEELNEICTQYELDLILGEHEKKSAKQAAVIKAFQEKQASEKKESPKEEKPDESSIVKNIKKSTVAELEQLVIDLKLEIDLDDYSKKKEKQAAIIAVLDNREE